MDPLDPKASKPLCCKALRWVHPWDQVGPSGSMVFRKYRTYSVGRDCTLPGPRQGVEQWNKGTRIFNLLFVPSPYSSFSTFFKEKVVPLFQKARKPLLRKALRGGTSLEQVGTKCSESTGIYAAGRRCVRPDGSPHQGGNKGDNVSQPFSMHPPSLPGRGNKR